MIKLKNILNESEESHKFSTDTKKSFLEIVSTYNKYQEMMDRKSDITKIAETLSAITDAAQQLAVNESDDWFDKHTVKRNMSELNKLGGQFSKIAKESSVLDQRMTGLYEDMGHILSRYYKIGEITEDEMKSRLGMTNESKLNERADLVSTWKNKLGGTVDVLKTHDSYVLKFKSRRGTIQKADDFKDTTSDVASELKKLGYKKIDESKINESVNTDRNYDVLSKRIHKDIVSLMQHSNKTDRKKAKELHDIFQQFVDWDEAVSLDEMVRGETYKVVGDGKTIYGDLKKSIALKLAAKKKGWKIVKESKLTEGADHILLQSIDMMIDSYQGHFISKDWDNLGGDIEFGTREWKQKAKGLKGSDKKTVADVIKGMNE